ncbi:S1C family serine protease [Deinococcus aquaedulcis]|uniref:S1C family serine protease n=1 Tax=Deinococcus aquaedulcis TaxID=2840455 RepID=UPI001C8399CA|nr:trypsin-like peptidase domain-containing protein [Deinococcus aquaedulcis]
MTVLTDLSSALADAVQAAAPSLVTVLAARPVSGTVVASGQVLTVAHLLHTDDVTVLGADGQRRSAVVAGRDPSTDLALLRVDGLDAPALAPAAEVRVGELLLAVGRPSSGLQATLGFMERLPQPGGGWLPTGAAPFRGVSGGALLGADGGLAGVLNAGVSRGELLAVPAQRALEVAALLASTGRVPRGYLGLATQPVHFPGPEDAPREGAGPASGPQRGGRGGPRGPSWERGWARRAGRLGLTVVQVEAGSPGEAAGLRVGDVLLALNGEAMRHPRDLLGRVRGRANQPVTLKVLRAGEEQDVTVTVGER